MTGLGAVVRATAVATAETVTGTAEAVGPRALPNATGQAINEAARVITQGGRAVSTAADVGMMVPRAIPEATGLYAMNEIVPAIRAFSPGAARVGTAPAQLFEHNALAETVDFLNRATPQAADTFFQNLAFTTRAANAPFSVAQVRAAAGLGNAANRISEVTRDLAAIRGVGQSAEFANLTRALGGNGITAEHATEAARLQGSLATLADRSPAVARAVADHAADNISNLRAIADRAEALVRQTETPTRLLDRNVGEAAQRQVAMQFMRATDDAAAARVLAPPTAATGAAPAAPAATGTAATGVPQTVSDLLPQSADTFRRMSDGVRASLAGNDGWGRVERLARENPALGRSLVSELSRNGGNTTTEGILQTGEWLARRAATDPGIVERTAAGSWLRNVLPEMVADRLRQGVPPQQAFSALDGLMRAGFPEQALYADLRSVGSSTIRDATQRTAYNNALDAYWARIAP